MKTTLKRIKSSQWLVVAGALAAASSVTARADYASTITNDNPAVYYRFNDALVTTNINQNIGTVGAAGNATNLNVHLIPGAIAGTRNAATYFDANAQTIIPWNAAINPNATNWFTIEAWFYPTSDKVAGSFSGPAPIMNRYSYSGVNRQGWVYFQRNPDSSYSTDGQSDVGWNFRTYTGVGGDVGIDLTSQVPYRLGEWQHVVTVWDGPKQTAVMYINGEAVATNTYAGSDPQAYTANTNDHDPAEAVNGAAGLSVGAYNNTQPLSNPFRGAVDEVAFYGQALEASKIRAHYQNGTNAARTVSYKSLVQSNNPLVYLRLDDAPGGADVALNMGLLQSGGDGVNTANVRHPAESPLAGTTDTGAAYEWHNGSSTTDIPWTPDMNPAASNVLSVELWVRPTTDRINPGAAAINNRYVSSGNRTGWVIFQRAPNDSYSADSGYEGVGWDFRMYTGNGSGGKDVVTSVPYTVGEWQHLVFTWEPTTDNGPAADGNESWMGTLTAYVNGVPVATNTSAAYSENANPTEDASTPADFAIGSYNAASGLGNNPYEGGVDEVAIYPGLLTPDQISAHYQAAVTPHGATNYETLVLTSLYDGAGSQALQPAGYFRLNEPALSPVVNSGTLGHELDASLVLAANNVSGPTNAGFGTPNEAVNLDGAIDWVSLNNPAGLDFTNQISLEAWVKLASVQGSNADIIVHGGGFSGTEVFLRVENNGGNYAVGSTDGSNIFEATFTVPAIDYGIAGFPVDGWAHLVGTYDGSKWTLYHNGTSVASTNASFGPLAISDADWAIGGNGLGWTDLFAGRIDEVAIYDHALSASQVSAHYAAGKGGVSAPSTISVAVTAADTITLTWTSGKLLSSPSVTGPFTIVTNAVSPYPVIFTGSAARFFELSN